MTGRSCAVALVLAVSAPIWADTAQKHVAAARAAEKSSDWRKALREWQAAYRMEINAEYLIGIGDAYAQLGKKTEARKQYQAYLADPLALPANAARVKGKLAALDAPARKKLALERPAPPGKKVAAPALPLPLRELDGAAAKAAAPGKTTDLPLVLPRAPGTPSDAAKNQPPPTAPASSAQTLAAAAPGAEAKPTAATEPRKAPADAITAEAPRPSPAASGGGARRTAAWVAAGVAVVALGGGALAYSKASSVQSELTGSVHDGATAKSMLDSEQQYKTLSAVGLAVGLVATGLSTALFVF